MNQIGAWRNRSERWMYAGGHPNRLASFLNRGWAIVGARRLLPNRLVTLEVRGRRTGRTVSVPLIVVEHRGEQYLVAMLAERASWVANLRAAGGRAVLRHGRRTEVRLEEVDAGLRAPILRRHLAVAPAARAFVPVDHRAPVEAFEVVAARFPVFRIVPVRAGSADSLLATSPSVGSRDDAVERDR